MTGMRPTMAHHAFRIVPPARKATVSCHRSGRARVVATLMTTATWNDQVELGYRPRCAPSAGSPSAPSCPRPSPPLDELAGNLRWSWHPPTQDLFAVGRPRALGATEHDPVAAARRGDPRAARASWPPTTASCAAADAVEADLDDYLDATALVPGARARTRPTRDRLLLARVRHHRGPAAVLRRPRHPGRRPPQGGQRPGRPAHRRRPALPRRLLPPVAVARRLAAGDYPVLDPRRAAAAACCARPTATAPQVSIALPGGRDAARAGSGRPRSAGCRCCCSTPTSRRTPTHLREVTDRLYGGGGEHRLLQEMLLGIGGVRALRAYARLTGSPQPEVFHTNEGHAGFLGLERIRELTVEEAASGLRRRPLEVVAGRHRLHHAHPGAGRHRPVPARAGRAVLRPAEPAAPACRSSGSSALGAEDYEGGDPTSSTWR